MALSDQTRRLVLGASVTLAAAVAFGRAHGLAAPGRRPAGASRRYVVDRANEGWRELVVHAGPGPIRAKWFGFGEAAKPGLLLAYEIPPGAGEGVHTHSRGDTRMGAYDEFYYVVSGEGVMDIDGEAVPITAGDHVFAPLGVPHGIRNTAARGDLKVLLTAVAR